MPSVAARVKGVKHPLSPASASASADAEGPARGRRKRAVAMPEHGRRLHGCGDHAGTAHARIPAAPSVFTRSGLSAAVSTGPRSAMHAGPPQGHPFRHCSSAAVVLMRLCRGPRPCMRLRRHALCHIFTAEDRWWEPWRGRGWTVGECRRPPWCLIPGHACLLRCCGCVLMRRGTA